MCQYRFRLPKRIAVTDEAIAEWLWQGSNRDPDANSDEPKQPPPPPPSGETAILPALTDTFRMVRADEKGAMFEFPASRLREVEFRAAIPRKCLRCDTGKHLGAHLVIYSSRLLDSFSLESRQTDMTLSAPVDELVDLEAEELLGRLPQVPSAPPPGNLPMPYWLCDMCSGTGLIAGQIQMNEQTQKGVCRLLIRNLGAADEFLVAVGGGNTQYHMELRRFIEAAAARPWQGLSETVQHRLEAWYKPHQGERFVTYIADRDRFRTEDGMSGIVITDLRLIFHGRGRHHEASLADSLEFRLTGDGGRAKLRIYASQWNVPRMGVDRDGLARLRRAMTKMKFHARWR